MGCALTLNSCKAQYAIYLTQDTLVAPAEAEISRRTYIRGCVAASVDEFYLVTAICSGCD